MVRYKYNPDKRGNSPPQPELGDIVYVADERGWVVKSPNGTATNNGDVYVEFPGGMKASIPVERLEVFDVYDRLRRFDPKEVTTFIAELCGPLEPCPNDEYYQVHARARGDLLQFLYCVLESHASIARPNIHKGIERFEKLGAWEKANVMYGLLDPVQRRISSAARYWANMARRLDEEDG